jgi:amidase
VDAELAFAGAARQAGLLRRREVSSAELTELYLRRIERLDPELNSYRVVLGERALVEAEQADRRLGAGDEAPLLGVPIAIKDGTELAGELTTHGTRCFDHPDAEDSDLVARIRAAGAVPIGKTNLPELAIHGFTESKGWGITRNPWNPSRTPGGSSGGSGAAVAAGLAPIAHASDGAGSIRWPAASCGLFGLKPQAHRVSMEREHYTVPGEGHWHGLSVNGCLTRSVLDTALFLDAVIAGPSPPGAPPAPERPFAESARAAPGSLRIAVSVKPPRVITPPIISEEALAAVQTVEEALRSLGHQLAREEPDFGLVGNDCAAVYLGGIRRDVEMTPNRERLDPRSRGYARLGRAVGQRGVRRALGKRRGWAERINRIFERYDLLLTLAAGIAPFEVGRFNGSGAVRTVLGEARIYATGVVWNYTGQPAAMVPAGQTREGLPVAAQLVARPNDEATLLSVAAQLESELGWPERRPPLASG